MDTPRNQPISAAEHAALQAWLLARGLSAALVAQAIGPSAGNQLRGDISNNLRATLKNLPKGP
jgi:hypothetical protein